MEGGRSGWWWGWDVSKVGFDWRRRLIAFDKPARDSLAPSLFLAHKRDSLSLATKRHKSFSFLFSDFCAFLWLNLPRIRKPLSRIDHL